MLPDLQQKKAVVTDEIIQNRVTPLREAISGQAWPGEGQISWMYRCWCLGSNLLFGVCGLVCLVILLPVLALCIYLESPGPIFYTQERLGRHRQPFRIYKFRSMCVNAEPDGKPVWSARDDDRVTRIGRFLRRTHLDELPQVLNILQGDMLLIGPRPEREVFAATLEQRCPLYRHRLVVRPGLTGWAQVQYGYGEQSSELQKLAYDLEYIQHRSIRFDLLILLKTVAEVLTLRGR
jgi:lipopolysaccharide/colanic/teichoic acid biosynthesis glycosyltransferase